VHWDESVGRARFVVSDRSGGVSRPPYDGLNLAQHVGDDPAAVATNRERFTAAIGARDVVFVEQVHGDTVLEVAEPFAGAPPQADGLVTRVPGLALAMMVADCVPVLLADPAAGVVGAAHAGRAGTVAGVARRVAEAMHDLGAREITARLGPSVCPRCYPVPLELREQVAAVHPEARSLDRHGAPSLDVAAGVLAQLAPLCTDVLQVEGCTVQSPSLYSYRRDGVTGRFAGAVVLDDAA
jgi:hypothetical protein